MGVTERRFPPFTDGDDDDEEEEKRPERGLNSLADFKKALWTASKRRLELC